MKGASLLFRERGFGHGRCEHRAGPHSQGFRWDIRYHPNFHDGVRLLQDTRKSVDTLQYSAANRGMLPRDVVGNPDFADIVQERSHADVFLLLAVDFEVRGNGGRQLAEADAVTRGVYGVSRAFYASRGRRYQSRTFSSLICRGSSAASGCVLRKRCNSRACSIAAMPG
jgi:hypothetical protein